MPMNRESKEAEQKSNDFEGEVKELMGVESL
jgi:hypothetical protein